MTNPEFLPPDQWIEGLIELFDLLDILLYASLIPQVLTGLRKLYDKMTLNKRIEKSIQFFLDGEDALKMVCIVDPHVLVDYINRARRKLGLMEYFSLSAQEGERKWLPGEEKLIELVEKLIEGFDGRSIGLSVSYAFKRANGVPIIYSDTSFGSVSDGGPTRGFVNGKLTTVEEILTSLVALLAIAPRVKGDL